MGANLDINGKQSSRWKNADVTSIYSIPAPKSKVDLLESIKKAVSLQAESVLSSKDDTKYRSIVDLIMLRVSSDLSQVEYEAVIDKQEIEDTVNEQISNAINKAYKDNQTLSIAKFAEIVSANVKYAVPQTQKNESASIENEAKALAESNIHREKPLEDQPHEDNEASAAEDSDFEVNEQEDNAIEEYNTGSSASLNNVQLNVDTQFKKLFNLCEATYAKPSLAVAAAKPKSKDEKKTPVEKYMEAQKKLDKKQQQSTSVYELVDEDEAEEYEESKKPQKITGEVAQNNVYKFNKKMFEGLKLPSVVLMVSMISAIDKNSTVIGQTFMALPNCINAGYKKSLERAKEIYELVDPSWLQKIINYFKDKLYDRLFKPIKERLIELIKKMMPKWLNAALDAVGKFWRKVKALFRLIFKGIQRAFKWLWRVVKTAFRWFGKVFGMTIRMVQTTIRVFWKAVTKAVGFLIRVLTAIFRFAGKGIRFIGRLFNKTRLGKFVGRLGTKVKSAIGKVTNGIKRLGSKIGKVFTKAKEFVGKIFTKAKNAIKNIAKKIVNAIKNVIKKVAQKVIGMVKNTVKKIVQKIMKRFMKKMVGKIVEKKAKSLLMMGAKKILGFFKNWVIKFIGKLAAKILGAAAVNAIPILGQIISVCMMLYTIYDTIKTFWEVYTFMQENPEAWAFMKEKVAEWASKTFDMGKKLAEWGKKLFKFLFIDGPKALAKGAAHALNFLFNPFSAAKVQLNRARYIKQLEAIKEKNFKRYNALTPEQKKKLYKQSFKELMAMAESYRPKANVLTKAIAQEQDSWWPDNKKIIRLMDKRQDFFAAMMELVSIFGIEDFSQKTCKKAVQRFDLAEKREKEMKRRAEEMAKRRKEMALKYGNKRIDIEALQKICQEQQAKQKAMNDDLESFIKDMSARANGLMDQLQDAIDGETDEDKEDEENEDDETFVVTDAA